MAGKNNLYKITLQGMVATYGTAYVVAEDPTSAYQKVRKEIDKKDLGFSKERKLKSIELIAVDNMIDFPIGLYL